MRYRRGLALLFGAIGMGASAASPAAASFAEPFDLSAAGQQSDGTDVAVDPAGDAVFVWRRFDGADWRVQTRARSAAGVLSAVQTLSSGGQDAEDPQVAVDDAGDAVFSWRRSDGTGVRVQARARSAAGGLSAVQTLSDPGEEAFDPHVAVDDDGDAVFAWVVADVVHGRVQARARSAAGTLSAVQTLTKSDQDGANPKVAVDSDGDAVFVWRRFDGPEFRIQARARSAGGVLSAVQGLSSNGQNAVDPQVAVDPGGRAVFAWLRSDGAVDRVQTRTRSAAGALSAVQTLSDAGQSAGSPDVAVDPGGDALFAWQRSDGANSRIEARARSAAATLSAVQILSPGAHNAANAAVALDAGGNAVIVWEYADHPGVNAIQARQRNADGALFAVQTLSDNAQFAREPQVAVDADGDAVSTWRRFDGAHDRIQAATGP